MVSLLIIRFYRLIVSSPLSIVCSLAVCIYCNSLARNHHNSKTATGLALYIRA